MQMRHFTGPRSRTISALAVVAAAGIALAGCSSGSGSSPSTPTPKDPTETSAAPASPLANGTIGKPVTVGSFTYTIESVKNVGKTISSAQGESLAQGQFVVVKMKVKNDSGSKQKVLASDFSAVTANSQAVEAQENDSVIVNGSNPAYRDGIAPGQTADVALVFDFSPAPTTPVNQVLIQDPATKQTVVVKVA